jgi:putative nucleotidyltransferase with HDIG domain
MPHMDGYQLCREWRADSRLAFVPVVFHSANYTSPEDEEFALRLGVDRFLTKPMDPIDILREVDRLLTLAQEGTYRAPTQDPSSEETVLKEYNARLVSKLEQQVSDARRANDQLQEMMIGTVRALAKLTEARDPYTSGHQERVADIAVHIAEVLGYDAHAREGIRIAGLMHDIGKISVPAEILTKPSALTDLEYAIIKMHPQVGWDVLSGVGFPWPVATYVVQHHERLNGSGYPAGFVADEIEHGSRILAVADVVDAMSFHRPYRTAHGLDAALSEIERNSGALYDEECARACVGLYREHGSGPPLKTDSRPLLD